MMKIVIQNLGPIHRFEFDLEKDLHLIYGENSVGKSYAAMCIYSILQNFLNNDKFKFYEYDTGSWRIDLGHFRNDDTVKGIHQHILRKLNESVSEKVDLREELIELSKYLLEHVLSVNIQDSFRNTYSSLPNLKNRFSNEEVKVSLILNGYTIIWGMPSPQNFAIIDLTIEHGDIEKHRDPKGISIMLAEEVMTNIINQIRSSLNQVYFLPASRSGLYQALNSFSPIIAELSKHRFYIKQKIELPTLSEPIADYFIRLSTLGKGQPAIRFVQFAEQIEKNILKGTVTYDASTKKIQFAPIQTDLLLDLSVVSSMVAELAPIVAYLKYILSSSKEKYHLFFIEEPEAHLHPKIQVKLMEIFAELAKCKVKVVMTSHSNYMFNKFGNLLLEKKITRDKAAIYHLVMTEKGSVVSDDMTIREDGIEDHNFAEVSERLYEERLSLYETVGSSADAI